MGCRLRLHLLRSSLLLQPDQQHKLQHSRGHRPVSLLPALAADGRALHAGVSLHLPAVPDGKRSGLCDSPEEPAHENRHQHLHPESGRQRPAGRDLLRSHDASGQPHHRCGNLVFDMQQYLPVRNSLLLLRCLPSVEHVRSLCLAMALSQRLSSDFL